jgi:hypothetical protein
MTRPASGNSGLIPIGLNMLNNAKPTIATPTVAAMPMPAPLGEARVEYTADDPRSATAKRKAGAVDTIVGTKLG